MLRFVESTLPPLPVSAATAAAARTEPAQRSARPRAHQHQCRPGSAVGNDVAETARRRVQLRQQHVMAQRALRETSRY